MAKLTVYIVPAGKTYMTPGEAGANTSPGGHIFYTVDKEDGTGPQTYGFAPKNPGFNPGPVDGKIYRGEDQTYSAYNAYTINITTEHADKLRAYGDSASGNPSFNTYSWFNNNCIAFVRGALSEIEVTFVNPGGPYTPVSVADSIRDGLDGYTWAHPTINATGPRTETLSPGYIDRWTRGGDGNWYRDEVVRTPNGPGVFGTKRIVADPAESQRLEGKRQGELCSIGQGERQGSVDPADSNPLATKFAEAVLSPDSASSGGTGTVQTDYAAVGDEGTTIDGVVYKNGILVTTSTTLTNGAAATLVQWEEDGEIRDLSLTTERTDGSSSEAKVTYVADDRFPLRAITTKAVSHSAVMRNYDSIGNVISEWTSTVDEGERARRSARILTQTNTSIAQRRHGGTAARLSRPMTVRLCFAK